MAEGSEGVSVPEGKGSPPSSPDIEADSRAAGLPRRLPLEGGYEVEPINPPAELQYECPVCLQVLREPHQATCCGYSFCKSCITRMRDTGQPCPTCKEMKYDVFADKRHKRALTSLKVRCKHQQAGCLWVGELGDLERHLNEDPDFNTRLEGCPFVELKCTHCEEPFQRKEIPEHEEEKCMFRPFSCQYCQVYQSTRHDVSVNHWPVCPRYPLECPNRCGVYPERRDLEKHIKTECPCAILDCPFTFAGCTAKLPAAEMDGHLRDNLTQHVTSIATHQQQLLNQLSDMRLTLEVSAVHVSNLNKERKELREQLAEQADTIQQLRHELGKFKSRQDQNKREIQQLQEHSAIAPIIFTLDDFEGRLKRKDMGWNPPPFYTRPQGYKMLLCVDVYGNGTGKGTHMSVFLSLLKGEFDEHLRWPFRASITICLENQEDEGHYEEVIKYHDSTPEVTAGRIMEEGRQGRPWGKGKFIAHKDLYGKYLKDNCLRIGICKVEPQH